MDNKNALDSSLYFAAAVKEQLSCKAVYLFGSLAKGNFNEDSDIDIAVVLDDYPDNFEMRLALMRIRRNIDSRIEPHPIRISEFNEGNPLAHEVLKYGRMI